MKKNTHFKTRLKQFTRRLMSRDFGRLHLTHKMCGVMIVMMILIAVVGIIRIYASGQKIADSLSLSERAALSLTVDETISDYDANTYEDVARTLYGKVCTADGDVLYSLDHTETDSNAFGSVLGTRSGIEAEGTGYVLNNYRPDIWSHLSYNALTGLKFKGEPLQLTIPSSVQTAVCNAMERNGVVGSVFCYNYKTGQTYCMASTPLWNSGEEGAYLNKNLSGAFTPGSTQKILAYIVIANQLDLNALRFSCNGSYKLPNGDVIVCPHNHGKDLNARDAIGQSCNCWIAQALLLRTDINRARNTLQKLGFSVDSAEATPGTVGKLPYRTSSIQLGESWNYHSLFSLIGQDSTLVSPVLMTEIAAAIAVGNNTVRPIIVNNIDTTTYTSFDDGIIAAMQEVKAVWSDGFQTWYGPEYSFYSQAKTGTCDIGQSEHKSLLCIDETDQLVMYAYVENYDMCHIPPVALCNICVDAIREYNGL